MKFMGYKMVEEKQKLFPSQEPEEKIFLLIRHHWFDYVAFALVAVVTLAPVFAMVWYLIANQANLTQATMVLLTVVSSILVLSLLAVELFGFISHYLDVYIVTNQRLVDISQNGLFKRDISELQMRQIQDVSAHVEGFFETILHFGDVYIQTAGERENFIFTNIPHPYTVSKQIIDLHEDAYNLEENDESSGELKRYKESELEKGLDIEDVETAAKKMVFNQTNSVRQAQGLYFSREGSSTISNSDEKKHKLEEGKEEKISGE